MMGIVVESEASLEFLSQAQTAVTQQHDPARTLMLVYPLPQISICSPLRNKVPQQPQPKVNDK